ncbi:MAG: tRNA lysidine(34) synthetase, partial [Pyrinomonadaceae bacterium]
EQNARIARYLFLSKTAENISAQAVLTAHTLNDQAETFLMNLIRGSGPDGLAGMSAVRLLDWETRKHEEVETKVASPDHTSDSPFLPFSPSPVLLIRPLLNWARRQDTEGYCHSRHAEYRYDSMNENLNFTRVRIRKLLLPMLEEFNPKIIETLANTAQLMQSEAAMRRPDHDARDETGNNGELSLSELKSMEKADRYQILRRWLANNRGNTRGLSLKHIEGIERLVLSRKSGKTVELPGGFAVVKMNGKLVYTDLGVEKSPSGN